MQLPLQDECHRLEARGKGILLLPELNETSCRAASSPSITSERARPGTRKNGATLQMAAAGTLDLVFLLGADEIDLARHNINHSSDALPDEAAEGEDGAVKLALVRGACSVNVIGLGSRVSLESCSRRPASGGSPAMEVALSPKWAKSRTRGPKRLVGRAYKTRADLEQQLKECRLPPDRLRRFLGTKCERR
jgi:hypothetical protein